MVDKICHWLMALPNFTCDLLQAAYAMSAMVDGNNCFDNGTETPLDVV